MAGQKPAFITGAKAVVKIGSAPVAFCSDVSYNVNVQHIPIESLGIFEIISNEPVAYTVDGTFSVVRYASNSGQLASFRDALGPDATSQAANDASSVVTDPDDGDSRLTDHINPGDILTSSTFDMEVVEKGSDGNAVFFKLQDCRVTRRSSTLNKRGVLVDNYAFVGVRAEDGGSPTSPTPPAATP